MIVFLNRVRLAFPTIWTPEQVNNQGDPKFSAAFPIEPGSTNEAQLDAAMSAAAYEKWAVKGPQMLSVILAKQNACFLKMPKVNASGEIYDGFVGKYFLNTSAPADKRPVLVRRDGVTPTVQADGLLYGGCIVNAKVEIWAQDNQWGQRINGRLLAIQFVEDAPAFGSGAPPSADGFADLGEPVATADDLI